MYSTIILVFFPFRRSFPPLLMSRSSRHWKPELPCAWRYLTGYTRYDVYCRSIPCGNLRLCPRPKLPYSIQWNIGVQHVVAKDYTFEVRYLGTRGIHLDMQLRINKRAVVTSTHSLPTYLAPPSQAAL